MCDPFSQALNCSIYLSHLALRNVSMPDAVGEQPQTETNHKVVLRKIGDSQNKPRRYAAPTRGEGLNDYEKKSYCVILCLTGCAVVVICFAMFMHVLCLHVIA